MRRIACTLMLLLALRTVCPTQTAVKLRAVPLSEVSGVVNIGNDTVVLIADEAYNVQLISRAAETFQSNDAQIFKTNMRPAVASVTDGSEASKKVLNDIEDVAWDNETRSAFVITSHSLNKDEEQKPARNKLARLVFKDGEMNVSHSETDVLKEALRKIPFVADAMTRPHDAGGQTGTFNIEGLAFDPRTHSLLIGLRSPTQMHKGRPCAVVLTLRNPHQLFNTPTSPPSFEDKPKFVDLGGLGIRGMTYDAERKGCWIIAGRSADPEDPQDKVASSIWFWQPDKPDKAAIKIEADLSGLENLEGVCLLKVGDKQGLLLISDDSSSSAESRALWLPIPELRRAKK